MVLDYRMKKMSELETPSCGASGKIQSLTRYTAYVMIQYNNCVEFVQFDQRSVLETASKIYLTEEIINI